MALTFKTIIKIFVILLSIITYIALILLAKKWYRELLAEEAIKQKDNENPLNMHEKIINENNY